MRNKIRNNLQFSVLMHKEGTEQIAKERIKDLFLGIFKRKELMDKGREMIILLRKFQIKMISKVKTKTAKIEVLEMVWDNLVNELRNSIFQDKQLKKLLREINKINPFVKRALL